MKLEDMILVSVDDHVVEPPEMFDGRLPGRYTDLAPRVVGDKKGMFNWVFGSKAAPSLTTVATAGRPPEHRDAEPTSYAEVRPGVYNVHERVKDMSANGVLAAVNFPSFCRFAGQLFADEAKHDAGLSLAVVRAYNDWHIEAWAGAYPDRLIPLAITPIWDPNLMADEVRRVAAKGCHAVSFSMNPYALGLPSLHDDHWDPFWAACDELGVVICMHVGSGSYMIQTSPDAPFLVRLTCSGVNLYPTAADLLWSKALLKFPNLTFALSEGELGWVPHFLERADNIYKKNVAHLSDHPFYGELPSERFNRRFVTCFIEDDHGVNNLSLMNIDNVTWECDYPHPDSFWPTSPEVAYANFRNVHDDGVIDKVTHLNAMRIFNFDPFSIRSRDSCTVSALRAEVAGHDTSFIPGKQYELGLITQARMLPKSVVSGGKA